MSILLSNSHKIKMNTIVIFIPCAEESMQHLVSHVLTTSADDAPAASMYPSSLTNSLILVGDDDDDDEGKAKKTKCCS